ncbi:MAG TPA: efflux RND transporter periplasmic adaptor subunit [Bacteroidia bacterium]|nr:efflux RND transporter periplasmic adaptor subunit [Bacteroidia bacterium]
MKNPVTLFAFYSLLLFSCSNENKKDKLKSDLAQKTEAFEKLRKEIAEIKIDLAKLDTTSGVTGKPVKLTTVSLTTFTHSIDIQGRVDAEQSVTVGPQMPGLVKRVLVHTGDKVAAGDLLAVLDSDALDQQLNAIKSQRDLAKQVYEKQKSLWDQKIGSEIQFLQSKTQYESLESQVASIGEQVSMARITAPMAGTVDEVNLKTGELAVPGFGSISIVNTNSLKVKAEVAEGYVAKVKPGNKVTVYLPDANKTITAKITYAGRMINKLNRTFNVEVALNPNETDVVPNMVAVLRINDYQNDSAITAPSNSIQETATGKQFVFVASKNTAGKLTAEKREVTYDRAYNGIAEIQSGLRPGDMLITEGFTELNPGDLITAE